MSKSKYETDIDSINYAIRALVDERGVTQKVMAAKFGISQSYLSEIIGGSKRGPLDFYLAIADFFELDIKDLIDIGRSLTGTSSPADAKRILQKAQAKTALEKIHEKYGNHSPEKTALEEYALIPMALTELSAGDGEFVIENQFGKSYAFRRDWINRVASSIKNIVLVAVRGDSMAPLICSGDVVMIDQGRRTIHDGDMYAIGIHETVSLKKLAMLPNGKICVISENRSGYPPFEVDFQDLRILGQVIWFARQFVWD